MSEQETSPPAPPGADPQPGSAAAAANPPPGFVESTNRGPFTSHNGPFFHKVEPDGRFLQGFRAVERHCNGMGIVHGGLITTFADGLMGTAVWRETGIGGLTIRLNADFLSIARVGDWVEGTARLVRATRTVAFTEADIYVGGGHGGGRAVMHATGVFRLLDRHRKTPAR